MTINNIVYFIVVDFMQEGSEWTKIKTNLAN